MCTIGTLRFYKRQLMNLNVLQQLPDHRYLYERYFTLLNELPSTMKGKNNIVIGDLAKEFTFIWTHCNIPFKSRKWIETILNKLTTGIVKLKKYPVEKRGSKFDSQVNDLRKSLECGLDIFGENRIETLKTDLGLVYGEEERLLYEDNCIPNSDGVCPRSRWCGGEDYQWNRKAAERRRKLDRKEYLKAAELERYQRATMRENEPVDIPTEEMDIEVRSSLVSVVNTP